MHAINPSHSHQYNNKTTKQELAMLNKIESILQYFRFRIVFIIKIMMIHMHI